MSYTTIAIIYNPNSTGNGEVLARQLKADVLARLPKQKVELIQTKHAGHGEELAYAIAQQSKHPLIISSSGDGGYNDVINGAMKAQRDGYVVTTGLLPAGNANDHYHNLHDEDIVEHIVRGTFAKIDVLKVAGTTKGQPIERYAHSYIGLGFSPVIGAELNKTKLNPVKEVWTVARSLFTVKPIPLKIGRRTRYYESVIFSNVDVMSKYLKISQPSSVTDGKFEVTIFRRRNKFKLIALLLKASVTGVVEDQQVSEFSLRTVRKTLLQADGEILTLDARSEVRVTVERQALACVI